MRGLLNGLASLLAATGTALLFCGMLMVPQEAFATTYTTAGCTNCTGCSGDTSCTGVCSVPAGGTCATQCGCNDNTGTCSCNQAAP